MEKTACSARSFSKRYTLGLFSEKLPEVKRNGFSHGGNDESHRVSKCNFFMHLLHRYHIIFMMELVMADFLMYKIVLPINDEDLLAECRVDSYRASGKGGQHVNVTDSAVRLTHIPTGIVVTSQKERSQVLNKKECLAKLRKKVEQLNYRKPPRIPTRKPSSVILKNSLRKAKNSEKKNLRRPPSEDI